MRTKESVYNQNEWVIKSRRVSLWCTETQGFSEVRLSFEAHGCQFRRSSIMSRLAIHSSGSSTTSRR